MAQGRPLFTKLRRHDNNLPHSASPLYEKIKDHILQNINSGEWSQDQRMPSENDLVSTFGVSRMTINRALRELTESGILVRVHGVGTFVAPPKPQSALLEIRNIAAEIRSRGSRHRAEMIRLESLKSNSEFTRAFELQTPRRIFHSIVIHFENDIPVQVEERYVNRDLAPDYEKQNFNERTTFDYLQKKIPLTEVEHVISSIGADAETATRLSIARGDPCLFLFRRTWSGTVVATVNNLTYAGRFSLGSRYRPIANQ